MAYNPSRFYEIMFGKSEDQQDYAVFKDIAEDLLEAGSQAGDQLDNTLQEILSKHSLEISDSYILFVLNGDDSFWPPMPPPLRTSLELGEALLRYAGVTSSAQFQRPTSEMEMEVDRILLELAKWCNAQMAGTLLRKYLVALKKHADVYLKLHPDIDPNMKTVILKIHFENALRDHPNVFQRAGLVQQIIRAVGF